MKMEQIFSISSFIILLSCILWVYLRCQRVRSLPPGPKTFPFVGNLWDLPHSNIAPYYARWRTTYGPVVYMRVFGREFIHLNSAQAAMDLLGERSAIYSDRPHLVMAGDLVGRKNAVLFHPYGERLKKYRKILHRTLSLRAASKLWALQEQQSQKFLVQLLESPANFVEHIRRSAGAVILQVAYGYRVSDGNDYYVALSEELAQITTQASEVGWMVDCFPFLRHLPSWLPGMHFKRWARKARRLCQEFTDAPFLMVKRQMADGVAPKCFTSEHLECEDGRPLTAEEEDIVKFAAAGLYAGGTDTTVSLITGFFLLMATHPMVQSKAQAEIDAVVGSDRLPTMADRELLPYIEATIKELHRFHPVAPLIPHSLKEDDIYDGYLIPKNAYVLANVWAILRDSSLYPHPEVFSPERYCDVQGQVQPDPRTFSFGFGRRICPAVHFTNASTFLAVARTLWAFNINAPIDEHGNHITENLDGAFTDGHVSHPRPFRCDIIPRSERAIEVVITSVNEA